MCLTPDTPNISGVGSDYTALLNQFRGGVPDQLATEAAYKPGFINTSLSGVNQSLYGGNGTSGLLQDFTGAVGPLAGAEAAGNQVTRSSNIGSVSDLGQQAAGAVAGVSPDQTALTRALTQTASTQLAAGTQLLPSDVNRITTQVRGDWASRGLGGSSPAQLDEALNLYGAGQNALGQRESAASSAVAQENQNITLPALGLATSTGTGTQLASGLLGGASSTAANAGASLVPTSQLSDIMSTVYNARAAANIAGENNTAGIISSALSY